jgi:hypothetical protein
MPTIRIDDDVYAWLQSQAVPFDDTPNLVLRRLAGLDKAASESTTLSEEPHLRAQRISGRRSPAADGESLRERWGIPAVQARFHRDGRFYEKLTRFPAALCDRNGYVVFATEKEYCKCSHLRIGEKVNVTGGIWSLPGYVIAHDPIT